MHRGSAPTLHLHTLTHTGSGVEGREAATGAAREEDMEDEDEDEGEEDEGHTEEAVGEGEDSTDRQIEEEDPEMEPDPWRDRE